MNVLLNSKYEKLLYKIVYVYYSGFSYLEFSESCDY